MRKTYNIKCFMLFSLLMNMKRTTKMIYNYIITLKRNMTEENISHEFRLKKIDETRNYFLKEIKHNYLVGKKHKKVCKVLNYIEHLFILVSTVTGCVLISALFSLVPIGIASRIKNLFNNCTNQKV